MPHGKGLDSETHQPSSLMALGAWSGLLSPTSLGLDLMTVEHGQDCGCKGTRTSRPPSGLSSPLLPRASPTVPNALLESSLPGLIPSLQVPQLLPARAPSVLCLHCCTGWFGSKHTNCRRGTGGKQEMPSPQQGWALPVSSVWDTEGSLRTNVHQNSGGAKEEADVVHHITDLKTTCQNKCVCTCSGRDQMAARPACSAHDDHTGAADECSLNAPTWAGPKGQSKEPKDMLAIRFLSGLNHPRSLSFPIYQMSYIECKRIFRFVNPRGFG